MSNSLPPELATALLDILPNPVLVKNQNLEYVWINRAFEKLFNVNRENVIGRFDKELFPDRQVSQCNGGDIRVLQTGEVDEAVETVFDQTGAERETITRKNRLSISDTEVYLIGVMHDITEVVRANAALSESQKKLEEQALKLSVLATTDPMTGCANRRQLADCDKLLKSSKNTATVMAIDLDHFKSINDQYGHDCGDSVLKHFCDLTRSVLEADARFVRLGGEEFAVILTGYSYEDSNQLAEQLRDLVYKTPLLIPGNALKFSVSMGIAFKNIGTAAKINDMLKTADSNLYQAKDSGRNKVVMTELAVTDTILTGT